MSFGWLVHEGKWNSREPEGELREVEGWADVTWGCGQRLLLSIITVQGFGVRTGTQTALGISWIAHIPSATHGLKL